MCGEPSGLKMRSVAPGFLVLVQNFTDSRHDLSLVRNLSAKSDRFLGGKDFPEHQKQLPLAILLEKVFQLSTQDRKTLTTLALAVALLVIVRAFLM